MNTSRKKKSWPMPPSYARTPALACIAPVLSAML